MAKRRTHRKHRKHAHTAVMALRKHPHTETGIEMVKDAGCAIVGLLAGNATGKLVNHVLKITSSSSMIKKAAAPIATTILAIVPAVYGSRGKDTPVKRISRNFAIGMGASGVNQAVQLVFNRNLLDGLNGLGMTREQYNSLSDAQKYQAWADDVAHNPQIVADMQKKSQESGKPYEVVFKEMIDWFVWNATQNTTSAPRTADQWGNSPGSAIPAAPSALPPTRNTSDDSSSDTTDYSDESTDGIV